MCIPSQEEQVTENKGKLENLRKRGKKTNSSSRACLGEQWKFFWFDEETKWVKEWLKRGGKSKVKA